MKRFVIAAVAVSLLATSAPVMAAPGPDHRPGRPAHVERHDNRGRGPVVVKERVVYKPAPAPHRAHGPVWHKGDRFDHRRAPRYVVIDNPRHYHLHEAPRGNRWVRSGNDAVLVGIASGIVAAVVTSILIN
ncbi:RcnB family protein [Pedomonas sp. V897]|uniref:RcnB family protein n=1 Tax=Pedomonas sp. V897 TaxID=3446482 RepID=UPI003EE421CF